jgi:hypothetical protein
LAKKRRHDGEGAGIELVRRAIREAKNEHTRRFWKEVLRLTQRQQEQRHGEVDR